MVQTRRRNIFSWHVDEQLGLELLRRHCQTLRLGQLVSILNASILAWLIRDMVSVEMLLSWWFAVVLTSLLRVTMGWWMSGLAGEHVNVLDWQRRFILSSLLAGAVWGASAILFLPYINDPARIVLLTLLTGMGAGALGLLNTVRHSYIAYILPLTLPAIVWCLLQDSHHYNVLGLLFAIYDVVMFRTSTVLYNTTIEAIAGKYEQQEVLQLLHRAEEISHTGSWLWDLQHEVLYWTDEHYLLLGLDPKKHAASYELFIQSVHPDDRQQVKKAIFVSINNKLPYETKHRILLPNGESRHVRSQAQLELSDSGEVLSMTGTMVDISSEVKSQEALTYAKEQAEHASYAKSDFLAVMSHEIRSPMNGVLGMLEMLKTTRLDNEQTSFANTAYNSASILLALLNDILDYSKIESGKLLLEDIPLNIHSIIEEVMSLYESQARAKGISISRWIDPKVPGLIRGDPLRIRQVIINFVSNAIKFTERGGVEIEVSTVEDGPDTSRIRISVRDTGIGINEAVMASLFSPFVQADNSMSRRFGGSGLGLSIAQKLMELMDGDIDVDSSPGHGATFSCSLPLRQVESSQQHKDVLAGMFAVIVSDDTALSRLLGYMLDSWGIVYESHNRVQMQEKLSRYTSNTLMLVDEHLLVERSQLFAEQGWTVISVGNTLKRHMGASVSTPIEQNELFELLLIYKGIAAEDGSQRLQDSPIQGRVLLVEDNLVNQMVAQSMLNKFGVSLDIANNGQEALSLWRKNDYQMILMDCQMPVMDGFAATQAIRAEEADSGRQRIPIVALTANLREGIGDHCQQAGMDDYMAKPYKLAKLRDTLSYWMSTVVSTVGIDRSAEQAQGLDSEVVEESTLTTLQEVAGDKLTSILDAFRKSARDHFHAMAEASRHGEYGQVAEQAHSLKGSALNIGARQLAELGKSLQEAPELYEQKRELLERSLQAYESALSVRGINLVTLH